MPDARVRYRWKQLKLPYQQAQVVLEERLSHASQRNLEIDRPDGYPQLIGFLVPSWPTFIWDTTKTYTAIGDA